MPPKAAGGRTRAGQEAGEVRREAWSRTFIGVFVGRNG